MTPPSCPGPVTHTRNAHPPAPAHIAPNEPNSRDVAQTQIESEAATSPATSLNSQ